MSGEQDLFLGRVLQNYRLVSLIGQGSVGKIYLGQHIALRQKLAVKILRPELVKNERVLARFFQEAKAVNEIRHENVVEIFDFVYEPDEDLVAIFMEYLHGCSLSTAIQTEAPFSLQRLGHIATQLCAALSCTHDKGIIHRDLKSDNIYLINRAGQKDFVKILDFGLVRPPAALRGFQTPMGTAVGTPLYMSPEQALGDPVDARSDIYSLGIILYEMATKHLPFYSADSREVMRKQILAPPPPPTQFNPKLTPAFEALLLCCLAKKREARFPSMQALSEALQPHFEKLPPPWPDLATPGNPNTSVHPSDAESAKTQESEKTLDEDS